MTAGRAAYDHVAARYDATRGGVERGRRQAARLGPFSRQCGVTGKRWASEVQPTIDALRALPEPERLIARTQPADQLLVFERDG